jgi:hypothetical protein
MKKLSISIAIGVAAMLVACERGSTLQQKTSDVASNLIELKVINWGPQSTKAGVNPNKQPDGSMGVWVEVVETKGIGDAQALFSGQPTHTVVHEDRKIITFAVSPLQIANPGKKEIVIKQIATNKLFPVGVFEVN